MRRFLIILFLSVTFANISDASHDKKLPSAVVVGTVYCDTCFQHHFTMGSHFISGASVAVECKDGNSITRFKEEVKTNEHGEFKVKLPLTVRKNVRRIKGCTFKLISSSAPHCAVASTCTTSSLRIKTRKEGEHIFSAGIFSFKPTQKPNFCNKKQSTLLPPIPFLPPLPPISFLPPLSPIPFLPPFSPIPFLPPLPPNPFLPPFPPIPFLPPLPPNPFLPPLPPNPFLPPSPPILSPIPPQISPLISPTTKPIITLP